MSFSPVYPWGFVPKPAGAVTSFPNKKGRLPDSLRPGGSGLLAVVWPLPAMSLPKKIISSVQCSQRTGSGQDQDVLKSGFRWPGRLGANPFFALREQIIHHGRKSMEGIGVCGIDDRVRRQSPFGTNGLQPPGLNHPEMRRPGSPPVERLYILMPEKMGDVPSFSRRIPRIPPKLQQSSL
jgi:hypothetical protein